MKFVIGDRIITVSDSYAGQGGYRRVYVPDHPNAPKSNEMYEHILVMEQELDRFLADGEQVHHIDEDKSNNDPENLMLFSDESSHKQFHSKLEAFKACGNEDFVRCGICKEYFDPRFEEHYNYGKGFEHKSCRIERSVYNKSITRRRQREPNLFVFPPFNPRRLI